MIEEKIISSTQSVCPECLKVLPAKLIERNNKIFIKRTCPKHGEIEELYYNDAQYFYRMKSFARDGRLIENPNVSNSGVNCPFDCGLCKLHLSHSALTNLVVTNRCPLNCWYCFFFAEKAGYVYEPTLEQIRSMLRTIKAERPIPGNAIQITGGSPSLRKDLIEIIKIIKEEGFEHIQLNTEGIRLSQDLEFAKSIRFAGVNTIYLSFDGTTPEKNPKNYWEIPNIINNCKQAALGLVLVPTIINSVNDDDLGNIIKFGFNNLDVVRSINFQPVSLVGRMPKNEREKYRITIPDCLNRIQEQTQGTITKDDFYPIPFILSISRFVEAITGKPQYDLSSHFACGAGTYVFKENNKIIPITRFVDVKGLQEFLDEKTIELNNTKIKNLVLAKVLLKLNSFIDNSKKPSYLKFSSILRNVFLNHDYSALAVFHQNALFIGMMHFMDTYNYDVQRVKRCCIHYAVPDGRVIPFCAFNVLPEVYRDKIQRKYSVSIPEWESVNNQKLSDLNYKRNYSEQQLSKIKEFYKRSLQ